MENSVESLWSALTCLMTADVVDGCFQQENTLKFDGLGEVVFEGLNTLLTPCYLVSMKKNRDYLVTTGQNKISLPETRHHVQRQSVNCKRIP